MTALIWDEVGERRYETGIDRGVLYLLDDGLIEYRVAHPWNGLMSVVENNKRENKAYYHDGAKYLDQTILAEYNATLSAFTYPDALDEVIGISSYVPGVRVHDQKPRPFCLSYRTRVGNDLEGTNHGYKLHVVYNVLANPSDFTMATLDDSVEATPMEWTLTGKPKRYADGDNPASSFYPSAHVSFDSRQMDPEKLALIEETIYGTVDDDPFLPPLASLINYADTGSWLDLG